LHHHSENFSFKSGQRKPKIWNRVGLIKKNFSMKKRLLILSSLICVFGVSFAQNVINCNFFAASNGIKITLADNGSTVSATVEPMSTNMYTLWPPKAGDKRTPLTLQNATLESGVAVGPQGSGNKVQVWTFKKVDLSKAVVLSLSGPGTVPKNCTGASAQITPNIKTTDMLECSAYAASNTVKVALTDKGATVEAVVTTGASNMYTFFPPKVGDSRPILALENATVTSGTAVGPRRDFSPSVDIYQNR
jgi:hypothetical protein